MTSNNNPLDLSKYRNPYDIIHVILKSLILPHSKTYVMYEAKMTWKQLDHYFEYLIQKRLIKTIKEANKPLKTNYQITSKGKELLTGIEQIKKSLN